MKGGSPIAAQSNETGSAKNSFSSNDNENKQHLSQAHSFEEERSWGNNPEAELGGAAPDKTNNPQEEFEFTPQTMGDSENSEPA